MPVLNTQEVIPILTTDPAHAVVAATSLGSSDPDSERLLTPKRSLILLPGDELAYTLADLHNANDQLDSPLSVPATVTAGAPARSDVRLTWRHVLDDRTPRQLWRRTRIIDVGFEEIRQKITVDSEIRVCSAILQSLLQQLIPHKALMPTAARFQFEQEASLIQGINVQGGRDHMNTRPQRILRWIKQASKGLKNELDSASRFEFLDLSLILATRASPNKQPSTPRSSQKSAQAPASSKGASTSRSSAKRLKVDNSDGLDNYWSYLAWFLEIKLSCLLKGLAQTGCYALIGFERCGTRFAFYQYRNRWTTMLVADEQTLVIETTESAKWNNIDRMSHVTGFFAKDVLPYDLDVLDDRDVWLQMISLVIVQSSCLPFDPPPSRQDLVNYTQPAFDRLMKRLGHEPAATDSTMAIGSDASSNPIVPSTGTCAPQADLRSKRLSFSFEPSPSNFDNHPAGVPLSSLEELSAMCGLARPSLMKTFNDLFPRRVMQLVEEMDDAEAEDAEDGSQKPRDDGDEPDAGPGSGGGGGGGGGGGDGAPPDRGGRGGGGSRDGRGGRWDPGAGSSGGGGEGGGSGSGGIVENGPQQDQGGALDGLNANVDPTPMPSEGYCNCHRAPILPELLSDSEYDSDDSHPQGYDSDGEPRARDPIRHMYKNQHGLTTTKALAATLDMVGCRIIWARPGTALQTMRELVLERHSSSHTTRTAK